MRGSLVFMNQKHPGINSSWRLLSHLISNFDFLSLFLFCLFIYLFIHSLIFLFYLLSFFFFFFFFFFFLSTGNFRIEFLHYNSPTNTFISFHLRLDIMKKKKKQRHSPPAFPTTTHTHTHTNQKYLRREKKKQWKKENKKTKKKTKKERYPHSVFLLIGLCCNSLGFSVCVFGFGDLKKKFTMKE